VIALTCRNGEQFSIDPDAVERVEAGNDTVVHLVDGAKYVVALDVDDLVTAMRDHRAAVVVDRHRLAGGAGAMAAAVPPVIPRRRRARADHPVVVVAAADTD
jgi:flagellar protein FlbD